VALDDAIVTDLLLDAGTLIINDADIGATEPEGTFLVEQEIYWPQLSGARADLQGTGKVIAEHAALEVEVAETALPGLLRALPTLSSASDASSEYTLALAFDSVAEASHATVYWAGRLADGRAALIRLDSALAVGGLTLGLDDAGVSSFALTLEVHYPAATPDRRPWQIAVLAAGIGFSCTIPLAADLLVAAGETFVYLALRIPDELTVTIEPTGTLIAL
jgi:hypothetical protein